jgi:hypothetical protein
MLSLETEVCSMVSNMLLLAKSDSFAVCNNRAQMLCSSESRSQSVVNCTLAKLMQSSMTTSSFRHPYEKSLLFDPLMCGHK